MMRGYTLAEINEYLATNPLPEPYVGHGREHIIGPDMDVLVHGPEGSGKTTLVEGLMGAVAQGVNFLGFGTPHPRTVLLLEAEGSTTHHFQKVAQMNAGRTTPNLIHAVWQGSLWRDDNRAALAACIVRYQAAVAVLSPVTALGFDAAGTNAEIRRFMRLFSYRSWDDDEFRGVRAHIREYQPRWWSQFGYRRAEARGESEAECRANAKRAQEWAKEHPAESMLRPAIVLVQHHNRAGLASGQRGPAVDTILHLTGGNKPTARESRTF